MDSKTYRTQLEAVYNALKEQPMTMYQVEEKTGVRRENTCRYVGLLRRSNKVAVVKITYCPISNHKAGFYTTDPALFPKKTQTELFL